MEKEREKKKKEREKTETRVKETLASGAPNTKIKFLVTPVSRADKTIKQTLLDRTTARIPPAAAAGDSCVPD